MKTGVRFQRQKHATNLVFPLGLLLVFQLGFTGFPQGVNADGVPPAPVPATPATQSPPDWKNLSCPGQYAQFEHLIVESVQRLSGRFGWQEPGVLRKMVNSLRDGMRDRLMKWHGHDYPIIAMDDNTPIKAYVLASDRYVTTTDELKEIVGSLDDVKAEFETILSKVERYPQRLNQYMEDTASLAAQIQVMEEYRATGKVINNLDLDLPQVRFKGNDTEINQSPEHFANKVQFDRALDKMRREYKARLGKNYGIGDGTQSLAMEQEIMIKQLQTLRSEILRQKTERLKAIRDGRLPADKPLPEDLEAMLARVNALFRDPSASDLKTELLPPAWARTKMKWMQLSAEAKLFFEKDLPELKEKEQIQQIVEWFNNLTDEEKKVYRLTPIMDAVNAVTQKRWVGIAIGALKAAPKLVDEHPRIAAGVGLGAAGSAASIAWTLKQEILDVITSWEVKKLECAALDKQIDFEDCSDEILVEKYPEKYQEGVFQITEGEVPEVKDAVLRAEIEDLKKKREKYLAELAFRDSVAQANINTLNTNPGGRPQTNVTPIAPGTQKHADDPEFHTFLFGGAYNGRNVPSLLDTLLGPGVATKYDAAIRKILSTTNKIERRRLLKDLKDSDPAVGTTVQDAIRRWESGEDLGAPANQDGQADSIIDLRNLGRDNTGPKINQMPQQQGGR